MIVVGIVLVCMSGCDKHTKHKVLTFFFTGVPSLEEVERQKKEAEEKKKLAANKDKTPAPETETAKALQAPLTEKAVEIKPVLYSHTPYAAGNCNLCHRTETNFRMFAPKGSVARFTKGGGMPGVLIAPRIELCVKCHVFMSAQKAASEGLWLHAALAQGEWNACHDPHQSNFPDVLTKAPKEICNKCHYGEKIMTIPDHSKPGECLDCHNPHFGKNKLLLKKDYIEQKYPVKQSPDASVSEGLPRPSDTAAPDSKDNAEISEHDNREDPAPDAKNIQ